MRRDGKQELEVQMENPTDVPICDRILDISGMATP